MPTRVAAAYSPEHARSTAGSTEVRSMADSARTLARSIAAYSKARPCIRYNIRPCSCYNSRLCIRYNIRPCIRYNIRPCSRYNIRPCIRFNIRLCIRYNIRLCSRYNIRPCSRYNSRLCIRYNIRPCSRYNRRRADRNAPRVLTSCKGYSGTYGVRGLPCRVLWVRPDGKACARLPIEETCRCAHSYTHAHTCLRAWRRQHFDEVISGSNLAPSPLTETQSHVGSSLLPLIRSPTKARSQLDPVPLRSSPA